MTRKKDIDRNRKRIRPLVERLRRQRRQRGYVHGAVAYHRDSTYGHVKYIYSSRLKMWVDAISVALGCDLGGFDDDDPVLLNIREEIERANRPRSEEVRKAVDAAFAAFCGEQWADSVFREAHEELLSRCEGEKERNGAVFSDEELAQLFGEPR